MRPYVLRLIVISPKPGWFEGTIKVRRHEAMEAARITEYQGTPWSEELDGKDSIEWLGVEYDLESK